MPKGTPPTTPIGVSPLELARIAFAFRGIPLVLAQRPSKGRETFVYRCPGPGHAHGDRHPSGILAVNDDGSLDPHCHVCNGSARDAFLSLLGWKQRDLYPQRRADYGSGRAGRAAYRRDTVHAKHAWKRPGVLDGRRQRELVEARERLIGTPLANRLAADYCITLDVQERCGVGVEHGRVVFPYRGHAPGEHGRYFQADRWLAPHDRDPEDDQPKVLSEPERARSPYILPPADLGADTPLDPNRVTLVGEGVRHAVTVSSVGLQSASIPSASGFDRGMARYLYEHGAHKVAFLRDDDPTGHAAAEQVVKLMREQGTEAWIVELPEGEDSADFILSFNGNLPAARDALVALVDAGRVSAPYTELPAPPETGRVVSATLASKVRVEESRFLDPERTIPVGALTLTVGDPGLGKSMLACRCAARVSSGAGGWRPGHVLIVSAEDSPAATLVPRLRAAGADLDRVSFVAARTDGMPDGLSFPNDVNELARLVRDTGAVYVVIDPLGAHLPADVNSWRDTDVRRALAPLARIADELALCIDVVAHLNKATGANPLYRVAGSVGGAPGAARSVRLLAAHPTDDEDDADVSSLRVVSHIKSNVGPLAPASVYRVEPVTMHDDGRQIETSRLCYVGRSDHDAASLLDPPKPKRKTATERAADYLRSTLRDGEPRDSADVKSAAENAGISTRTLQRALGDAGVQYRNTETTPRQTLWRIPEVAPDGTGATDVDEWWHDCGMPANKGFSRARNGGRAHISEIGATGAEDGE